MFRQIYELTVLGMPPAIQCPRRSHFAPFEETLSRRSIHSTTDWVGIDERRT
jgi:hypothetical protein